jgi:hypothetical protein
MANKLLVDDFVDPLGWLTETGACIDDIVDDVRLVDGGLSIKLSCEDKKINMILSEDDINALTLPQAAEILSEHRGHYLLRALAHRISEGC